jgi:hypothetical protein
MPLLLFGVRPSQSDANHGSRAMAVSIAFFPAWQQRGSGACREAIDMAEQAALLSIPKTQHHTPPEWARFLIPSRAVWSILKYLFPALERFKIVALERYE